MPDEFIVADQLCKRFGMVDALRGLDFVVPEGAVLGMLGPNGAGKTTAVRILTTLCSADSGRAVVGGYDISRQPEHVRRIIACTGQDVALADLLTGRENLRLFARLRGLNRRAADRTAAALAARFELDHVADRRVMSYSGGMRRRLDLAVSLIGQPAILFLDEP